MDKDPKRADAWEDLSAEQRAGMTEAYWNSLPEANRQAFLEPNCIKGDGRPRVYGSPYCAQHLRELQDATD